MLTDMSLRNGNIYYETLYIYAKLGYSGLVVSMARKCILPQKYVHIIDNYKFTYYYMRRSSGGIQIWGPPLGFGQQCLHYIFTQTMRLTLM